jgi:hypothetical protein
MKETKRAGDAPEHNWTETTVGDAPCSIVVSTTAKGTGQFEIKLTFRDADELREQAQQRLITAIDTVKAVLMASGIPLAGQ